LGNAEVTITGGVIHVSLPTYPNESPTMFLASDAAVVEILGGRFEVDQAAPMPRFSASDESVVRFYGSTFNYPFGAITDLAGQVQGTLGDGSEFNLLFTRTPDARIELVRIPEPAATPIFLAVST
jgi:hypothetical protein